MGKRISVPPVALTTTVANLLNGAFASLSGPIGFTPTQPRIVIKAIHVENTTGQSGGFAIYKGASGGSASGTQVFGTVNFPGAQGISLDQDIVLEASDFLTGVANAGATSGQFVVTISAEIVFGD